MTRGVQGQAGYAAGGRDSSLDGAGFVMSVAVVVAVTVPPPPPPPRRASRPPPTHTQAMAAHTG